MTEVYTGASMSSDGYIYGPAQFGIRAPGLKPNRLPRSRPPTCGNTASPPSRLPNVATSGSGVERCVVPRPRWRSLAGCACRR